MIIQFGNKLHQHGKPESFMETLFEKLKSELGDQKSICVSEKMNPVLRMLDMIMTLVKYRNETTLIIIHSFSTLAFWYTAIIGWLAQQCNIPYVIVLHGGAYAKRLKKNPGICKRIFSKASLLIAPSEYLQAVFQKHGFDVAYLPNFINLKNYNYRARNPKSINLLWVRAFSQIYNPELFVEIIFQLKQQGYQPKGAMVGPDSDGSLAGLRRKIIALHLENEILITGKLEKNEWIALADDYSYFLNTTHVDNRPISVIEAMALGLTVVSTNVGGMPTLIHHNETGILLTPNNAELFVNEIISLSNDEVRFQNLSFNARIFVEQFDWSGVRDTWHANIKKHQRKIGS